MNGQPHDARDQQAEASVARLIVVAGLLVPGMVLLIASKLAARIDAPVGMTILRLWTDGESGTLLIVLSTIAGALWAALIVRRARYRRSSLMALPLAASLPALSSALYIWFEVRKTAAVLLGEPSFRSAAAAGFTGTTLIVGMCGLLASATLAFVLAGAIAALFHATASERIMTGLAIFPLLGLVAVYGIWSIRQAHLLESFGALAGLSRPEEKLRMLSLVGREVSWSAPAAAAATILWLVLLASTTWAVGVRGRAAVRLLAQAAMGWAVFALHVTLPRQAPAIGGLAGQYYQDDTDIPAELGMIAQVWRSQKPLAK